MTRPDLLVLGAHGFLGRNLIKDLEADVEVAGFGRDNIDQWKITAKSLIAESKNVSVINCIAMIGIEKCQAEARAAKETNVDLALNAAKFCKDHKIPFFHVSTDGLFGEQLRAPPAYWKSSDKTWAINVYAQTKLQAEKEMSEVGWGHCLRMSFVGPSRTTGKGLISFVAQEYKNRNTVVRGFTDVWFTPLHTRQFSEYIKGELKKKTGGYSLRHLGSSQGLTKFDFLKRIVEGAKLKMDVQAERRKSTLAPLDQSLWSEEAFDVEEMIGLSVESLRSEIQ